MFGGLRGRCSTVPCSVEGPGGGTLVRERPGERAPCSGDGAIGDISTEFSGYLSEMCVFPSMRADCTMSSCAQSRWFPEYVSAIAAILKLVNVTICSSQRTSSFRRPTKTSALLPLKWISRVFFSMPCKNHAHGVPKSPRSTFFTARTMSSSSTTHSCCGFWKQTLLLVMWIQPSRPLPWDQEGTTADVVQLRGRARERRLDDLARKEAKVLANLVLRRPATQPLQSTAEKPSALL